VFEGHPFRDAPGRKLLSARIQTRGSRLPTFVAIGLVAAVWNVICWWQFASAVKLGPPTAIAFVLLFVLIGLVLLGSTVHAFFALFNPTVEIFADDEKPAIGDKLELRWRLMGKASRVRALRIIMEGTEQATYTRGTNTTTERHTFLTLDVAGTTEPAEIADGGATVLIPHDAVPSFTAKNNTIMWRLLVQGEIANWPDIDEAFPLDVVAHRRLRTKAAA
jgi:hypothetical protein